MKAKLRAFRYLVVSWLGAVACGQVLGIEDARVDPSLKIGPSAGESSASGGTVNGSTGGTDGMSRGGVAGSTATGGAASGGRDVADEGGSPGDGGTDPGSGGKPPGEAGAGGAPVVGESLCEQYCNLISAYCATDEVLQYKDRDQCLEVCKAFPEGTIGGADGNTVACRLKYASKARYGGGIELAAYCRQAGPGGDGRCGSNCDGFCSIMMSTCTPAVTELYSYTSDTACQSDCQTLPTVPFAYGALSVADGNSVGCRLFHVISAVMADAEEHCEHARGITLCEAPPAP